MSIREFLHRFLWHVSAAAIVLLVVLLIGEYLVPGSVLPFVDVIDATMGIAALVVLTVILPDVASGSRRRRESEAKDL